MRFTTYLSIVALLVAPAVRADDERPRRALSFAQAVDGVARSKAVVAAQQAWESKAALVESDVPGRLGNPTVTVLPGWRVTPEGDRGLDLQLGASLPVRHANVGAASRRAQRAEQAWWKERARTRLTERRINAARAWIEAWRARGALRLANERLVIADSLADASARALELRASTRADVAAARSYVAEARLQAIHAEGELYEAEVVLASEAGLAPGSRARAHAALPTPPLGRLPRVEAVLDGLPAVALARLNQRAAAGRAAELLSQQSAQTSLSLQLQRESPDAWIAFAGAMITLPWQRRGQRALAESRAVSRWAASDLALAQRDGARALEIAFHEVEHTEEVLRAIESEALPRAVELVNASRELHQAGEITTRELLLAEQRAHQFELLAVHARADMAWARVLAWLLLTAAEAAQ